MAFRGRGKIEKIKTFKGLSQVMSKTKFCLGMSEISDTYMGFIVDQWGVLHNGEKAYDGVVDCLKELKHRKKFIIVLSNSGKRAEENKARLKEMGIGPSLYDLVMTSGEMTWQGLRDQNDGIFNKIGKRCYLFSRGGDRSIVEGSGVEVTDDIEKADFLIISGSDAPQKSIADYEPVLRVAAKRGLKALCANPDSRALLGAMYVIGPGLIARRYEEFGGVVHYIGKPHQPIFQHCIKLMIQKEIYAGQIVVVGDTMGHDIMGGWYAGLDTCLVRSGLHAGTFRNARNPRDIDRALEVLVAQYNNIRPNYLVDKMVWGKSLPDRKHRKRAQPKSGL